MNAARTVDDASGEDNPDVLRRLVHVETRVRDRRKSVLMPLVIRYWIALLRLRTNWIDFAEERVRPGLEVSHFLASAKCLEFSSWSWR